MPESFQRIWHGKSEELCHRIPDGKVDCIITDPPFGVNNQSNQAVTTAGKKYARKIANDETPEQAIAIFHAVMSVLVPKVVDDADIYVFTSYQVLKEWLIMLDDFFEPYGFQRVAVLRWEKDGPGMGDLELPFGMACELIMQYRRGRIPKKVTRRNSTLYVPQIRPDKLIHPHEKPPKLLQMLGEASTDEGGFIVDPFGGSCSLARAMRPINRSALCIEYDETNYRLAKEAYDSTGGGMF